MLPIRLSTHTTHAGMVIAPLQMPPVHAVPKARDMFAHAPAVQLSVVQTFPSLQWATFRHSTHTRVGPEVSQAGATGVHPSSSIVPGAESRHGKHIGELMTPSHTPPAQVVPDANEGLEHVLEVHRSSVQMLPSLQSPLTTHRTHAGVAMDVSHMGVPEVHPVSVMVPL